MAVSYADETDVLIALRDRLRQSHSEFTEKVCFLCDTTFPPSIPAGRLCITIVDGTTTYDESTYMGAGANALDAGMTVFITVINRCALDTVPKTEDAVIHERSGLLRYRRLILKPLLLSDSQYCEGHKDQWVMKIGGKEVLREGGPIPKSWSPPRFEKLNDRTFLSTTLTLTLNFDQDL